MNTEIAVQSRQAQEFVEITDAVADRVREAGILDGQCMVYCPHTTAGLTINENADSDVCRDMIHALDKLVPLRDPAYRHNEGNSAAHVKASLMGASVIVPIADGRLYLGRWQGIYLCEFDGPRTRHISVTVRA